MCFALMDEDGSGSIDASEMGGAFKLLNIKMHPREIEELLAEVDPTGAGELDFLEVLLQLHEGRQRRPACCPELRARMSGGVRQHARLCTSAVRRAAVCGGDDDVPGAPCGAGRGRRRGREPARRAGGGERHAAGVAAV